MSDGVVFVVDERVPAGALIAVGPNGKLVISNIDGRELVVATAAVDLESGMTVTVESGMARVLR